MRPFEILMSAALGLSLACGGFMPGAGLASQAPWIALLIAVAMLLAHLLVEGPHLQLVPAYMAFVPAGGLIWVLKEGHSSWPWVVAGMLLLVLSGCLSYAIPMFRLPRPTGVFATGTTILHMVDESRIEDAGGAIAGPGTGAKRELMVQLWYPTEEPGGIWKSRKLACYRRRQETSLVSSYQAVLRTHSYLDAEILRSDGEAPFPVVLFNPAWRGRRTQNTFLTEELASHGYVVAAIDHTYNSMPVAFPDGRVVVAEAIYRFESLVGTNPDEVMRIGNTEADKQALDVRFVLDELGRLNREQGSGWFQSMDTENAGCCGHSLGGGVSVQAWATEARIKAAMNLDGWSFGSQVAKATRGIEGQLPEQPLLFVYEDGYGPESAATEVDESNACWPREVLESTMDRMDYGHVSLLLRQYGGYWLKLKGANHGTFTDRPITSPIAKLAGAAEIDARRAHRIVRDCAVQFFDQALKQKKSSMFAGGNSPYKELLMGMPGNVDCGTVAD